MYGQLSRSSEVRIEARNQATANPASAMLIDCPECGLLRTIKARRLSKKQSTADEARSAEPEMEILHPDSGSVNSASWLFVGQMMPPS